MSRANLTIGGMSCGGCVRRVSEALAAVPGVTVERVAVGAASVSYDPSKASVADLTAAVSRAGFTASAGSAADCGGGHCCG